jgi:iron complex outermembrane receptor protein
MNYRPLLLSFAPFALGAQTEGAQTEILPPLVVAGEQVEESLTPVGVISREAIGVLPPQKGTYQDLFALTAGAYAGSPSLATFSLRGVSQDNLFSYFGTGSNPLIHVLENGVPLSSNSLRFLPPTLWDIESAEVLRGPQLAQGPNSLGGALLLTTRTAGFDSQGQALTEVSEWGGFRGGLAQDFTLLPEELALRLSYLHQQTDGQETNVFYQDDEFGAFRRDELKIALRWHPGKNPDATIDLFMVRDSLRGNPIANSIEKPNLSLFARQTFLDTRPSYPSERHAVTLLANVKLPNQLDLQSTTSFQIVDLDSLFDLDLSPSLHWFTQSFKDEVGFTQNLILAKEEGALPWRVGAYLEHAEYDIGYSGIGLKPFPMGSAYKSITDETVQTAAVYGQGDWEFAPDFFLSGALRLNHEQRDLGIESTLSPAPAISSGSGTSETVLLPQLGVSWKPEADRSCGLRVARGYRGGGVSYTPTLGKVLGFEAENAWETELYTRWSAMKSLWISGALFHSELSDQQVPSNVTGGFPGIDTLIYNAASARSYGAELESIWKATDSLSITGNVALTQTEFRELTLAGKDRSGQAFPNAPEWIASLGVNYHHAQGWFSSAIFSYADSTYTYIDSPQVTRLESRKVLSAKIGYAWKNASLYGFGSNLLDDEYALFRADNRELGFPNSGKATAPRLLGIGCELRW